MIFHGWAVVVMLNVLVAMLSHSFDRVRNNAELEWKFHRSKTWMKYIQKGVSRPPPMNLFPSVKEIRTFWNFLKVSYIQKKYQDIRVYCIVIFLIVPGFAQLGQNAILRANIEFYWVTTVQIFIELQILLIFCFNN